MKKVFSMFLVLMMVLGLFAVCGLSAMAAGDVTILFTANMSGASQEAYDEIAALKDEYEGALLVDAGGYSADAVDAMSEAGYDLAADGAAGNFTVISLAESSSNGGAALSANGSTVAFVSLSRPSDVEDEAYYEAVQSIVDQAQSNGVSYVVGIGAGVDASGVAANVTGLDAILTGSGSTGSAGLGEAMVVGANGGVGVLTLSDSGVSCSVEAIAADGTASEEPAAEDEEEPESDEETVEEDAANEEETTDEQVEELPAAEVIEDTDMDAASGSDLEEAPVSESDAETVDTGDKTAENTGDQQTGDDTDQNNDENKENNTGDTTGGTALPDETVSPEPSATATPTAAPTATPAVATAQFVKGNTDLVLTASAPVTGITFTYTGLVNGVATSITRTLDSVYYTTSGNTATIKASSLNSWGNGTYTFNLEQESGQTNIKVTISGTAPVTTTDTTTTTTGTGSASTVTTVTDNSAAQTTTTTTTTANTGTTTTSNAAATVTPAAVTAAAAATATTATTATNSGIISSLVPSTGDTTQILPWVIGLVVLALALIVVVVVLKKRQTR